MKLCRNILLIAFILPVAGCASRKGKSHNIDLESVPGKTQVLSPGTPQLKILGIPAIQIDSNDQFEVNLEAAASKGIEFTYKLECPTEPCPSGLKLTPNGRLSYVQDNSMEKNKKYSLRVKVGQPGSAENSWTPTYLTATQKYYGYMSGDRWTRIYSNSSKWAEVSPLGAAVLGQYIKYGDTLTKEDLNQQAGSSIYLGSYANEHLVLTASHVFKSSIFNGQAVCDSHRVYVFQDPSLIAVCKKILWRSAASDAVLLSVSIDATPDKIANYQYCLETRNENKVGDRLAIAGYGSYRNLAGYLGVSTDDDCKVITTKKFDFKVSSTESMSNLFIAPCDLSDGDSGGALLNLSQQKIAGMLLGGNNLVLKTATSSEISQFDPNGAQNANSLANSTSILLPDLFDNIKRDKNASAEVIELVNSIIEKNDRAECKLLPKL